MRVLTRFTIEIVYGQIALFDPSLDKPYNDWTDQHVKQGFSWREGSVSFSIDEDGMREILVCEHPLASSHGQPATMIDVPFFIPQAGEIEVGTVNETRSIEIAPGPYQVRFYDFGPEASRSMLVLALHRCNAPVFEVCRLRRGDFDGVLVTSALPA